LSLKGTEVTDTGITWLAERCTSLMTLNLTKCGNVSYAGIKAIRESWRHVQLIKTEEYFGLKPVNRGGDKRYIDEFGAIWSASTKIQSIYRSKIARRKMAIAREEHLRHWTARKLQSVWRGRKARRYAIMKKMQKNVEQDAAILMQSVFRAKRARRIRAQRQLEFDRRKMVRVPCSFLKLSWLSDFLHSFPFLTFLPVFFVSFLPMFVPCTDVGCLSCPTKLPWQTCKVLDFKTKTGTK
jgi:hypothetical protein